MKTRLQLQKWQIITLTSLRAGNQLPHISLEISLLSILSHALKTDGSPFSVLLPASVPAAALVG